MRLTKLLGVSAAAFGVLAAGVVCSRNSANAGPKPPETVDPAMLPALPANAGDGDYAVGPDYTNAPELTAKPGVPQGMVYHFSMSSTDSQFYPGIAKNQPGVVPYHRRVSVYVPANYVEGKPLPFLISQDSMGGGEIPTILDNMIADKRLPAMAAIFIDSGGGDAQGSERGLEYDTVSGKYAEFIEAEVIPRVERPVSACQPDQEPGWTHGDGRQFRRSLRVYDGMVPSGVVSSTAFCTSSTLVNPQQFTA